MLTLVLLVASKGFAANCTISGQVFNVDGTPAANATITFNPVVSQSVGGTLYTAQPTFTTTDNNGNLTAITLPQGLLVQITIQENGANFPTYTVIVPFMSSVSFTVMNQGIGTNPLNVLASAQPPTGPLNMAGFSIQNAGCPVNNGDVEVQGCGNTLGSILITGDTDYGAYNLLNVGGINLLQQPAVTSIQGVATCTGTCATTYTYEITCVTSTGETNASAPVTLTNAATLTSNNFNTLTWPSTSGASCNQGYNIYGRTGGSLGFLINIPQGTNTYTDNGFIPTPVDSWTMTWNKAAFPSVIVWDLRGLLTSNPVDVTTTNSGNSAISPIPATGFTTTNNNETQIPIFAINKLASGTLSWPSFPGGFSNTLQVNAQANINYGIEGGTKTIATAGTVASTTVTFSPPQNVPWATMNLAFTPANTGTPATIVSTLNPVPTAPYSSVTFGDPAGATSGDVMVVCTAYLQSATLVVPSTFNLITKSTYQTGNVQTACYWALPNGTFGKPPPTMNTTGGINQQTATGTTINLLTPPAIPWPVNTGAQVVANTAAISSTSFPQVMTVIGCRSTYNALSGCSVAPTYAILDATASKTICSVITATSGSADASQTVTTTNVPANDVITFAQTGTPHACTGGTVSMTPVFQPPQ